VEKQSFRENITRRIISLFAKIGYEFLNNPSVLIISNWYENYYNKFTEQWLEYIYIIIIF
jgi:hypothetical protein